jgi:hypothetical protein
MVFPYALILSARYPGKQGFLLSSLDYGKPGSLAPYVLQHFHLKTRGAGHLTPALSCIPRRRC